MLGEGPRGNDVIAEWGSSSANQVSSKLINHCRASTSFRLPFSVVSLIPFFVFFHISYYRLVLHLPSFSPSSSPLSLSLTHTHTHARTLTHKPSLTLELWKVFASINFSKTWRPVLKSVIAPLASAFPTEHLFVRIAESWKCIVWYGKTWCNKLSRLHNYKDSVLRNFTGNLF
jgi:hypothetical protein